MLLIQPAHEILVSPVVGRIIIHAQFLLDDLTLLGHIIGMKVRFPGKVQQQVQAWHVLLRCREIICRRAVLRECIGTRAILSELNKNIPLLLFEELMLQEVGDSGGGFNFSTIDLELEVDRPIPGGRYGDFLVHPRLGQKNNLQAAGELRGDNFFLQRTVEATVQFHA